jgi:hypothetical protein
MCQGVYQEVGLTPSFELHPLLMNGRDLLTRHNRLSHNPQQGAAEIFFFQRSSSVSSPFRYSNPSNTSASIIDGLTTPTDHSTTSPSAHQSSHHSFAPISNTNTTLVPGSEIRPLGCIPPELDVTAPLQELPFGPSVNDFDPSAPYTSDDFTSFLDSIPLPIHPFSPVYQPLPYLSPDSLFSTSLGHDKTIKCKSAPRASRSGWN